MAMDLNAASVTCLYCNLCLMLIFFIYTAVYTVHANLTTLFYLIFSFTYCSLFSCHVYVLCTMSLKTTANSLCACQ